MNKIWQINAYQEDKNFNFIEKLLNDRGINSELEKEIYLNSDLKYLSDPFLLSDMEKAVQRIKKAIKNDEKILIYGDYDVDGITSTALLYRFFNSAFNHKLNYFLPDRIEDGYGLNIKSLAKIAEKNIDLIITVDCGITAFKEAEYLKEKSIDLIITDHHTPGEKLPKAEAVINHHLVAENNYFAAELAGVGTAYKLAQALDQKAAAKFQKTLLPIAALGTIADIAPLVKENRIIVKKGLEFIAESKIIGLKSLIKNLQLDISNISAGQVGYIIVPPLNAAGRISCAEEALKLLITEDQAEAEEISQKLIKLNKKRQITEEQIYKEAEDKIKELDLKKEKALILADPKWHSGIIGIVASRLVEKYNLAVILFAVNKEDGIAKGSARSISSLNIYQALNYCSDLLLNFGGHKKAAGLTIKSKNLNLFKNKFQQYLEQNLNAEDYYKKHQIDLNLKLNQLNKDLIKKVDKFKPFGAANPSPRFIFEKLTTKNCYQMGSQNKHLKLYLDDEIEAVAFNFGDQITDFKNNSFDLIAQPEINSWQGQNKIQLKVRDYRISSDISTAVVYQKNNISFYNLINSAKKSGKLKNLLQNQAVEKAAVYINNKKEKKEFEKKFKKHYFFGSSYNFETSFSHLIFYSLPFSLKEFYLMIAEFKKNTVENLKIILLFSKKDSRYNKKLIEHIIEKEAVLRAENELDFKDSIRYNKLSKTMDKFQSFAALIFKKNLFNLIEKLVNFEEDYNEPK